MIFAFKAFISITEGTSTPGNSVLTAGSVDVLSLGRDGAIIIEELDEVEETVLRKCIVSEDSKSSSCFCTRKGSEGLLETSKFGVDKLVGSAIGRSQIIEQMKNKPLTTDVGIFTEGGRFIWRTGLVSVFE